MTDPSLEAVHSKIRELAVVISAPVTLIPLLAMPAAVGGDVWIEHGKRRGVFSLLSAGHGGVFSIASAKNADDFIAKVLGHITQEMARRDLAEQGQLMALLDPVWAERLNKMSPQRFQKDRLVLR